MILKFITKGSPMHAAKVLCLSLALLLTGCAIHLDDPTPTVTTAGISGSVFGGEQPIVGSSVALYAVGNSGYGTGATQITTTPANAVTDAHGNYSFSSITCPSAGSGVPTYLLVTGGNAGGGVNPHIVLTAATGYCGGLASLTVNVSEVTTVATAYAMGQFFTPTVGGAPSTDMFGGTNANGQYNLGLQIADEYTVPQLVNLAAGSATAARTTSTSGTVTVTREPAKLYTIANILLSCVNTNGSTDTGMGCGTLFFNTTNGYGTPADTLQAAVMMSLFPYRKVAALYALQTATPPFAGGLTKAPNDWTLGISYTSTAFQNNLFNTSTFRSGTNIDIDSNGNVWFPTNSAGSHGIARLLTSTPNPFFDGPYLTNLSHPQYLAITNQGRIYATDTASPQISFTTTDSPARAGTTLTTTGFTGPVVAAATSASGGDDIVYTAGGSASSLGATSSYVAYYYPAVYPNDYGPIGNFSVSPVGLTGFPGPGYANFSSGSGANTACDQEYIGYQSQSETEVSTGTAPCYAGGIALTSYNTNNTYDIVQTVASTGKLCDYQYNGTAGACFTPPVTVSYPQAIASDGYHNLWIANYGNSSVSTLGYQYNAGTDADYHTTSPIPYIHNATNGATLTTPSGIAIDRSGNVWIANACISALTTCPASFTLSELIGAAGPTLTPLAAGVVNGTTGTLPTQIVSAPTKPQTTQPVTNPRNAR